MLDTMRRLRRGDHPTTNLERNIRWLVSGDGFPVGCPGSTRSFDRLETMRGNCVENLGGLRPGGEDTPCILDVLRERLEPGVECVALIDEVVFNEALSAHFANNEADHALIRWLLEGEFLETEYTDSRGNRTLDTRPNRTITNDLDSRYIVRGLPLHISSEWVATGRGGPHTMGPAARLLCYWTRGEYLGSCSIDDVVEHGNGQRFFGEDERSLFHVRHGFESPHFDSETDDWRGRRPLRRRIRLHALARVEVFTMVRRDDGLLERWVLRDMHEDRYKHALSESYMPEEDQDFTACAQRGVREELGVNDDEILANVNPVGGTRIEWGGGQEHHDSQSMPGLPSMMCINPFSLELSNGSASNLVKMREGIPARQFQIKDAGHDSTLNWLPAQTSSELEEVLATYDADQGVEVNRWYALNYHDPATFAAELIQCNVRSLLQDDALGNEDERLREALGELNLSPTGRNDELIERLQQYVHSNELVREQARLYGRAFEHIEALIGGTILFHYKWENSDEAPPTMIGRRNEGVLYKKLVKRGTRSLGMDVFIREDSEVSSLVDSLVKAGIVEPHDADSHLGYLASIGRLLQPNFSPRNGSNEPTVHWFMRTVWDARRRASKAPFDNNSVLHLLNWDLEIHQTIENQRGVDRQNRWRGDLDELFGHLNNAALWSSYDGTLSSLLANQPHYQTERSENDSDEEIVEEDLNEQQYDEVVSTRRTVVLFKMLENGSYDVRLREGVDIPLAQRQSALLNCLREREDRSGDVLDTTTRRHMENTVAELREGNAMVIRLE